MAKSGGVMEENMSADGACKPGLVLHAGTHKTGTSAIQQFAYENRETLERMGLLYPDYGVEHGARQDSHLGFFHSVAGTRMRISEEQIPIVAQRWLAAAQSSDVTTLLSAEALWRHVDGSAPGTWLAKRKAFLGRVAEVLRGFDVKPVVVLRNPEDFVTSLYQEAVIRGAVNLDDSFPDFVTDKLRTALCYYDNLRLFEEIFGEVHILLYEELVADGDLCHAFFRSLGFDVSALGRSGTVRASLDVRQTLAMAYINGKTGMKDDRRAVRFVKSDEIDHLLRQEMPQANGLWPDEEARNALIGRWTDDEAKVRARWFPARDRVFGPSRRSGIAPVLTKTVARRLDEWVRRRELSRSTTGRPISGTR